MLYIVLVLVLAALGLLVAALITANSLWAWISIGLSVLAGLLLVFDWLRRRGKRAAEAAEEKADTDGEAADETSGAEEGEEKKSEDAEQTVLLPATGELGDVADTDEGADTEKASAASSETQGDEVPGNGDPGEEKSDAADVQIVSELETEIVVVDEYPRYHLTDCEWLANRDTIPLGIGEARQLGFTPCALCTPDATIAERHRDKTKADS